MSLHFKLKWRASGSDGTEQLVAMLLPSKSFLSQRDVCSRVVWESWRPSKVPSKQMGPFRHMCRPHFSMFTLTLKAGKKGWNSQLHASQTWLGITSPGDLRGTYSGWPHHQTWWFRTLRDGAWRTIFQGHHRKTFGGQQKTITLLSWTVTFVRC